VSRSGDWTVAALADFAHVNAAAGDAGYFYIWMMNGPAVIAGTGYTLPQADLSWRVESPKK
jgi:hypothetical protein